MAFGLVWALLAALLTGSATVLEALGARRAAADPALRERTALVGSLRQWPFLVGVGMDMLGFGAELMALDRLPLYEVEAVLAGALAVTAVGAARVLRVRLRPIEWGAVLAVCVGLALLAVTAGRDGDGKGDEALRVGVLLTAIGLVGAGWAVARARAGPRAALLGLVAGLQFGVVGVAVRVLPATGVRELLTEPAAYAVAIAGVGGFVALTTAMQCGSVTAATSAMVMGETIGPAVVGVLVLGDDTRHGAVPPATAAFALSIAGALTLARFGDAEQPSAAPPAVLS